MFTKSDADALRRDWEQVGRDMWRAIHQYESDDECKQHWKICQLIQILNKSHPPLTLHHPKVVLFL
ncbi:MAG: hypothetical protein R3F37_02690 [Candidatus Competibacteraceae bacterium]